MKISTFTILLFFLISSCNSELESAAPSAPPNVLLIIGDDHGYADLGFSKLAKDVNTPNFDRLAQQSVFFKNAYATSPICSPSRVGLMTGAYHQRQQVFWYGGKGLSNPEFPTIAELLLNKGYKTGYFGKFHYGSKDADIEHRSFPLNHGYQKLFGCNGGRKHYLIHNNEKEEAFRKLMEQSPDPKQSLRMEGFWNQDKRENIEGFSTEMISQKGIDFMKKQIDENNSFFATVSFNAVHNFTHQLPQEYLDKNNLKGYRDWDPQKEDYYDWYNQGRKPNNPEGREHYLGQLYYLDKEVGRLIDFLEQEKQMENTIIVYIGDNGGSTQIYANNTPFQGGKYTMYEGGLRVPLMISWKGHFEKNTIVENMVSAMDVLPTICEATETPFPKTLDGFSLQPILKKENPNLAHEYLVWYGGQQAAIRNASWKYRWANDTEESFAKRSSAYEGVGLELGEYLYNLEKGNEQENVMKDGDQKELKNLKKELDRWKMEIGVE